MEELLDKKIENHKNHFERIIVITFISIALSVLIFIAGEADFFQELDKLELVVVLLSPPILTIVSAIISAYPISIQQAKNLNSKHILAYSFLPFTYTISLMAVIFYRDILNMTLKLSDLIEPMVFFSTSAAIASVIIASITISRDRAISNKSWFFIPPATIIVLMILSLALYNIIEQIS